MTSLKVVCGLLAVQSTRQGTPNRSFIKSRRGRVLQCI
jgi:hypothetical protein